jgi:hypothetical protein
VVVVRDLEASLRFCRDGIGLDLLQDRHVEGDWPDLFDAPSRRVRAVFLGDAAVPDDHAGVLELNVFDGDIPTGPLLSPPRTGFFLPPVRKMPPVMTHRSVPAWPAITLMVVRTGL